MMNVVPSPGLAVHANLAGVFLNDAVGDGKAQPGAAAVAAVCGLFLVVKNGS